MGEYHGPALTECQVDRDRELSMLQDQFERRIVRYIGEWSLPFDTRTNDFLWTMQRHHMIPFPNAGTRGGRRAGRARGSSRGGGRMARSSFSIRRLGRNLRNLLLDRPPER